MPTQRKNSMLNKGVFLKTIYVLLLGQQQLASKRTAQYLQQDLKCLKFSIWHKPVFFVPLGYQQKNNKKTVCLESSQFSHCLLSECAR